ncbi:tetratricopeptide repeat protein [Gammaproteobacteria bacterium]|nr:tetratricopeptide repeat protein [Gammaproteobacteria bacterium]
MKNRVDVLSDIDALKAMAGVSALISPAIRHFEAGNMQEAEDLAENIVRQQPNNSAAVNLLGNIALSRNQFELARELISRAVGMSPNEPSYRMNLCVAIERQGFHQEALGIYEDLLRVYPDYAEAHYNHALLLLLTGDYRGGWKEYEWRKKMHAMQSPYCNYVSHQWKGEPLNGRSVLVCAEQGLGDTIQFIRYVDLLVQLGGKVMVQCQASIRRLLSTMPGIDSLTAWGDHLPDHDVQVSLLSLPYLLGTTLETVPGRVPYLFPSKPPRSLDNGISVEVEKKNVGIVWAGNPRHKNDQNRSVDLSQFRSLIGMPGVKWYSLQVGSRAVELVATEGFDDVTDTSPMLKDFSDTATVIERLDLVITVDTSVAHLAGALGIPVWVLLPYNPDWRWLLGRADSPWYPSMRLFRQSVPGDWSGVFSAVSTALRGLMP